MLPTIEPIASSATLPPLTLEKRTLAGWLTLGCLWLLAVGFILLTASNYRRVALAGERLESLYRLSDKNDVGRGLTAKYEATQPPTMFDPDSHCWINLTQRQIADGTVRPHDFPWDNAPYGRGRHWSSSFSWWLLAVGEATHLIRGWPLTDAMTQSAAWANPILFVLFLAALGLVLRRHLEPWTVGIFLVTLAALYGVEWDFSYGRPDHHGLHLMAFLGLLLGALTAGLGWVQNGPGSEAEPGWHLVRPRPWREARFWFSVSAVCGGIGLWIGSTQQCVCVAVLGVGAVLGALLFARPADANAAYRFAPELWRHWARVGAGTSLFFYLLEYFPSHMEVRLEVNHPFIALGWLGAGEWMYVLLMTRVDWPGMRARAREMGLRCALGLLGVSVFPLALVCGPKTWCWLTDPILLRTTKVVSEGRPWIDPPGFVHAVSEFWTYMGALPLVLPLAVWLLVARRRQLPAWRLAGLTALLVTAVAFLAWTLLQNRWMGFVETSLAVLALLAAPCVPWREGGALPLAFLALTVPGWAGFGLLQTRTLAENPLIHAKTALAPMMGTKEAAWNLRLYSEQLGLKTPARVMGPPGPSPVLHYYGGVDTVGSYYWENLPGCHVTVDFFMDEDGELARRIARERGLDFVMVMTQPTFVMELQWLQLGRIDKAALRRTLAFRLANPVAPQPPAWLEALPLQDAPLAREQGVRLYRVVKAQL